MCHHVTDQASKNMTWGLNLGTKVPTEFDLNVWSRRLNHLQHRVRKTRQGFSTICDHSFHNGWIVM